MDQHDRQPSIQKHQDIFEKAFNIVQKPLSECLEEELDQLMSIIHDTRFFQANLDSRLNFIDFVNIAKNYINYEKHPYGTILIRETDHADKFSVIIKGTAVSFKNRSMEEIEREATIKHKNIFRGSKLLPQDTFNEDLLLNRMISGSINVEKSPKARRHAKQKMSAKIESPEASHFISQESIIRSGSKGKSTLEMNNDRSNSPFNFSIIKAEESVVLRAQQSIVQPSKLSIKKCINGKIPPKRERKKSHSNLFKLSFLKNEDDEEDEDTFEKEDSIQKEFDPNHQRMMSIEEENNQGKDYKLFQYVTERSPQYVTKYFASDICKLRRVKVFSPGDYFGQSFLPTNKSKQNLILASEEVHLLTISRDDYSSIMSKLHEKVRERVNYFISALGSINEDSAKSFAYYFREEMFQKGEKIYKEGDFTDKIYLVKTGCIRLTKKIDSMIKDKSFNQPNSPKYEVPMTSVVDGQFFGEELFLKKSVRDYTAISNTLNTRVYSLDAWLYHKIKGGFADLLNVLKVQAKDKLLWRSKRLEEVVRSPVLGPDSPSILFENRSNKSKGTLEKNNVKIRQVGSMTELKEFKRSDTNKEAFLAEESAVSDKKIGTKEKDDGESQDQVSKNLEMYKKKFYRKQFFEKGSSKDQMLKRLEHAKSIPNFKPQENSLPVLNSSPKKDHKTFSPKHMRNSVVVTHNKASFRFVNSPTGEFLEEEIDPVLKKSIVNDDQSFVNAKQDKDTSMKIPTKILDLLPQQNNREFGNGIVKKTDGTLFIVSGRSKLRNYLKAVEHLSSNSPACNPKNIEQSKYVFSRETVQTHLKLRQTGKLEALSPYQSSARLDEGEKSPMLFLHGVSPIKKRGHLNSLFQ